MAKTKSEYRCSECGWSTAKWVGQCSSCQAWGTVSETTSVTKAKPAQISSARAARPITDIETSGEGHYPTGVQEFDRVLGGGLVPGAVVLLSGEPGVGKSTLLLEVAARLAKGGKKVLYVSAEESASQVKLRATRTSALSENLFLATETDLSSVLGQIDQVDPELIIVDSVQTVSSLDLDGVAGMPAQVREVASNLIRVAKESSTPLVLVGHVTKDGSIAGPRTLEHLVDVVCHFEGDRQTSLRFIRTLKNRFGPTDEVGCFEMSGEGIIEVPDPSALFVSEQQTSVSGTCITITVEGRRALRAEIQALVVKSSSPQPRRVTNGVDSARVAMLLAVLERRAGLSLSDRDVYVSTVGGMKITEPAADLAIAIAIASAVKDKPAKQSLAAFGEISLSGEIRGVTNPALRQSEAKRLGHTKVIDSSSSQLAAAIAAALS
ncbi:MAG: DNA repair protein RadA [Actinobacteria bacterium]|jgi:DNA repair protein RadA/Sms|nr:DNA repair protein RadA [Actinomycetota bacterium]MDA2976397.1 DNA repair protein RadA [Actinomycetota bacterium]NCV98871.1 DNA repair protein RadA [Actinomycetota bacterium]NCX64551.1 DNA repair protein RadA [Actinomycetota bacterium]